MKSLPVIATSLVLAACAVQKPAPLGPQPVGITLGTQLNAQQIRSEIVGNTGTGTRTGTASAWSLYVAPDGTAIAKSQQPTDTGTWKITDDGLFCMHFKATFEGKETCQSVHKAGVAIQMHSLTSTEELVFQPGNKL